MRPRLITLALAVLLGTLLDLGVASATDCQDALGSQSYRCDFKQDNGTLGSSCFYFSSPSPANPTKLELLAPSFTADFYCTCKATGSLTSPAFNAAKEFICLDRNYGDALEGKVSANGRKISKGQYLFNDGTGRAYVLQCRVDPGC